MIENDEDMDGRPEFRGTWRFFSSSGVRQTTDMEYLYFGFWKSVPEAIGGDYQYEHIYGGNGAVANRADLTGVARFRGGAVGEYVVRNQAGESDRIGTFTANANLTADFGGDTLGGSITDFRDGSQTLTGWIVTLGGGVADEPSGSTAFAGASVTNALTDARFGNARGTGMWSATLHGTQNIRTGMIEADYPVARYPVADLAGIVGLFNAASDDIAVAGTFGATPQ